MTTGPVRVELHAEWPGGSEDDVIEIDRAEWTAMTPEQRDELLTREASEFLYDRGCSSGWTVLGDEDEEARA
jgi:hypothetical protein